jgi:hypothetical protein
MRVPAMVTGVFLLLFIPGSLLAQHVIKSNKIDPYFKVLLESQSPTDTLLKKVDCIIHTTKPEALKKKGITVIAVSPRAVTAVVTPAQLLMIAGMPEVKFIEAPEYIKMHPKQPTYPNPPKQ